MNKTREINLHDQYYDISILRKMSWAEKQKTERYDSLPNFAISSCVNNLPSKSHILND